MGDIGVLLFVLLIFEWVLIFQNFIVMVPMGTCIRLVLVFDEYLYSRLYGTSSFLPSSTLNLSTQCTMEIQKGQ